jgi:hypothetical protein
VTLGNPPLTELLKSQLRLLHSVFKSSSGRLADPKSTSTMLWSIRYGHRRGRFQALNSGLDEKAFESLLECVPLMIAILLQREVRLSS